jgi:DNA-binding NarL/FixJ family response regulator
MLLAGMSFKSIAAELGLAKGTILWHARQVYKHHNVRTLVELLTKHNRRDLIPPRNPTEETRRRILAGESNKQIAAALNVGVTCINNQRQLLRKKGVKLPDARAGNGGRRRKARAAFAVSSAGG